MYWYFDLERVPDLSLTKYMSLDESGVDGVLKKHASFLRQLNRKGLLSRVFFHLLYRYDPDRASGEKLSVSLIAGGEPAALLHTRELIQSSAVSPYYDIISSERACVLEAVPGEGGLLLTVENHLGFRSVYRLEGGTVCKGSFFQGKKPAEAFRDGSFRNQVFSIRVLGERLLELDSSCQVGPDGLKMDARRYGFRSVLSKREFFVQPSVILPDDNDLKYYKVARWEMSEDARLYNMLALMKGLDCHAVFRVDLFAVDYALRLREVLPIQELRDRTSMRAVKSASSIAVSRDENAEETLKQYNELIESYESSPHFRMNLVSFADEADIAELVADAAGAEALEAGSYTIRTLSAAELGGPMTQYSAMDRPIDTAQEEVVRYLRFLPNLFLLEEVRPFFLFPALYDGESVEIPKETSPSYQAEGLRLAVDENGYDVTFPVSLFKKHAFLAGVPGSGKTNSMLHLCSSLWKRHGVPFLIFEPAKQEYRALAGTSGMEELLIFSPSSGTLFPLHINPFEFPLGMSLSEHIRNLMAVFEGAFSLAPPAPFMIDYSVEAIYREKGWYPDTINEGKLPYPTMADLYARLEIEVEKTDYEGEIKGNLKSILQVRIGSLLRREMGDVFNVPRSSMAPEEWLHQPALIELEAMGSGPANFLSLLLSTLIRETLKITPNAGGKELRHVIFFEEAHNLIGPVASEVTGEDADPKLAATAFVVKMLAEVRALREGIVIADQLPTVMAPEVIKNTGLKIGHRITAEDDRNLLGSTMSASGAQLEQMATFLPGEALITFEGLLRPFKAQICQWEDGTASYDSPSNRELSRMMWDFRGYRKVLSRSSSITCTKFESQQRELEAKAEQALAAGERIGEALKETARFARENNLDLQALLEDPAPQDPLAVKAQDALLDIQRQRRALLSQARDCFSSLEELLVKEKGYLLQNRMYQRRTAFAFLRASELRLKLWEGISRRCPECSSGYEAFTQEMASWNLKPLLVGLFQGGRPAPAEEP